jgi:hypothetical protein
VVKNRLALNSSDTWVSGARIEALLEYDYPVLSVFSPDYTKVFTKHKPVPTETNKIVEGWQQIHNTSEFIDRCASLASAAISSDFAVQPR